MNFTVNTRSSLIGLHLLCEYKASVPLNLPSVYWFSLTLDTTGEIGGSLRAFVETECIPDSDRHFMSLQTHPVEAIPELTARIAKAAFSKGNPYLTLRDHLGILFQDEAFSHLFSRRGQPAQAPWRLTLVTIMQFAEDLSDVQAADAVRSRLDWKYALSLELDDPGFDASVLCEFRARLLQGDAEKLLLDTLLAWCREKKLLKAGGKQRTDSTHVLAAVRTLNR